MSTDFELRHFINNEFVASKSTETFSVYNPNENSVLSDKVPIGGEADVDAAVDAALAAYKGEWGSMSGAARGECLFKFAELLKEKLADIQLLETQAMGVPVALSAQLTPLMTGIFKYYAGWADKIMGQTAPADDGSYKIIRYEPLGVCAGIGAWNATLLYVASKIAPALAAGNTFIFKASEKSPFGVMGLAPLIKECFPAGVINIVHGDGKTGALLASHMKIRKISFTGSVGTGKKIQDAATKSNLKRVTLELGGKSAAIVFDDADIENALQQNSMGFLVLSGQACTAASRILVQEGIAEKFIEALKARYVAFGQTMGDPMEPTTFLGPLADQIQFKRVMAFIESGKQEATLLTGGARRGDKGNFVEPTIFLNPKDDARVYKEEIFGPVSTLRTFKTEEEAIELSNNTNYGLAAAVYTNSVSRALRVSGKLEAGTVTVNAAFMPNLYAPFGGFKESGLGRENGWQGLLGYVEVKSVIINMAV